MGGEEPNVYLQSSRSRVTYRICQLLDQQQDALISYLLGQRGQNPDECPLPSIVGSENRVRVDPEDAIPVYKIYRDVWERGTPQHPTLRMQRYMEPCCPNSLDYPEVDVDAEIERFNRM